MAGMLVTKRKSRRTETQSGERLTRRCLDNVHAYYLTGHDNKMPIVMADESNKILYTPTEEAAQTQIEQANCSQHCTDILRSIDKLADMYTGQGYAVRGYFEV